MFPTGLQTPKERQTFAVTRFARFQRSAGRAGHVVPDGTQTLPSRIVEDPRGLSGPRRLASVRPGLRLYRHCHGRRTIPRSHQTLLLSKGKYIHLYINRLLRRLSRPYFVPIHGTVELIFLIVN